jgi:nucleoside-diphosphate-sugar epimerase
LDSAPKGVICAPKEECSIKTLAEIVGRAYGLEPVFVDGPDGQMRKYAIPGDFPEIQIGLEEGIASTVEWFNKHRSIDL